MTSTSEPTSGQPIHVSAVITGKPGTGDQIESMLVALAGATHQEQGCLLYSLQRGIENPDQFVTVEKWTDNDALTAHLAGEPVQSALASAGGLLAGPPMIIPALPVVAGDESMSRY